MLWLDEELPLLSAHLNLDGVNNFDRRPNNKSGYMKIMILDTNLHPLAAQCNILVH